MNESIYMLLLLLIVAIIPIAVFGTLIYFIGWQLSLLCLTSTVTCILVIHLYNCRIF